MSSGKSRSYVLRAVLLLGIFSSYDAAAALDLKGYRLGKTIPETKTEIESYVNGLRDGVILFDAYRHRYEKVKEKFCIDGKNLNSEKTIAILDLEIADPTSGKSYPDDIPIVFVLIKALERFSSCK